MGLNMQISRLMLSCSAGLHGLVDRLGFRFTGLEPHRVTADGDFLRPYSTTSLTDVRPEMHEL
jgi:hypothetical protein